jgi:peptidoglycan L-alanyl-D-glutamate endopeptidase CwlK
MKDEKVSQPRIELLHPSIREEVKYLIEQAETVVDETLAIRVVQGLRTIEEQDALYAQGRTTPGSIVTKAKGGSSYHNYGLAIDICWLYKQDDGSYKYDDVKSWKQGGNFRKVIEIFKASGYTWGGDFKSIPDGPHFEKTFGLNWRDLLEKYNNNNFITDTKYVNI